MKVVILAGGFGTRLSEETGIKPKPMIEIGRKPILWHILKIYSFYGFNDFIICLGYNAHVIKEYFKNYFYNNSDFEVDLFDGSIKILHKCEENWKITLVDTGLHTMTGGRIKQIQKYIDSPFMITYGDGLADIAIDELVKHHDSQKKLVTMTSVLLEGRFGYLSFKDSEIINFNEKGKSKGNWINAGFFVCDPKVFGYIENNETVFEKFSLEKLVNDKQIAAYKHEGFWKCMDTLKDLYEFEELWKTNPVWKVWP